MPTSDDLIIFTNEDGQPWAAFVWGEADPAAVAALITEQAVKDATGYSTQDMAECDCSWPPRVQTYWLREIDDLEDSYGICAETDEGAQRITGHRFYPQG